MGDVIQRRVDGPLALAGRGIPRELTYVFFTVFTSHLNKNNKAPARTDWYRLRLSGSCSGRLYVQVAGREFYLASVRFHDGYSIAEFY